MKNLRYTLPKVAILLILLLFVGGIAEFYYAQSASENQKPTLNFRHYPYSFNNSTRPITARPKVLLDFNAPVDPKKAEQFFSFLEKKTDNTVGVNISTATIDEVLSLRRLRRGETKEDLDLTSFLLISPSDPLFENGTWYLRAGRGFASRQNDHVLHEERTLHLGTHASFEVYAVEPSVRFDTEMYISVGHNKYTIRNEDIGSFVSVEPAPKGMKVTDDRREIKIEGDFQFGKKYKVTVKPGLIANDGTRMEAGFGGNVEFQPAKGFLTLPGFSSVQSASGNREFELKTGNLKSIRTRIKQLEEDDLILALAEYSEKYEGWGDERSVKFSSVRGKKIYDRIRKRQAPINESETVDFHWDFLGKEQRFGAFYFCAEGKSEAGGKGHGGQALIQLTDIGLAWKRNNDESLVYVFSLETGAPLPGVQVSLRKNDASTIAQKQSDASGVVRFPAEQYKEGASEWLDARHGEDRHVMRFGEYVETVGLWSFSIPYRYNDHLKGERRTEIFTDRGVYKPGEEVFVKVISREISPDQLLPAAGGKAKLRLFDPRRRKIMERDIELSARGSFDDSIQLPEAGLGWYSMEVDFNRPKISAEGEEEWDSDWRLIENHSFQVEEYKVNTFEVGLDTQESYQDGVPLSIPVSAKYYMGKALSKSQLNWTAHAFFSYPETRGFDGFDFGSLERERESFSTDGLTRLSSQGQAAIDFSLPEQTESPMPRRVSVTAEITDVNQQTISQSSSFTVHSSDFYLGIRVPEGVHRAGDAPTFALAAMAAEGGAYDKPVETTMRIERETWNTVKVVGAEGKVTTRNERNLETIHEQTEALLTARNSETGIVQAETKEFRFTEAGDYIITLEAQDEQGRKVVTKSEIDIIGAKEPTWSWHDVVRVDMIPDKETYQIGDTAKVLLRSPIFGDALITTERGGVREVKTVRIEQFETVLEFPVKEGDAPNLFASALIVRGSASSPHHYSSSSYRMGYCELKVDDPASRMQVSLDTGEAQYYQPGEEVEIQVQVTAGEGEGIPVADAEVTLWAADEGVLSLTGYRTPDPAENFHQSFPLAVLTGQSISNLLPENPLENNYGNKGYVIGGGGLQGMLDPDRVRKDFKALALWKGALLTNAAGQVTAKFTAPDNLTTFRVMAVVAEGNRFGKASAPVVVNKPLIIEPALPRFSNLTDQIDISAVIHNNTNSPQDLEVEVQLDKHALFLSEIGEIIPTNLTEIKEEKRRRTEKITIAPQTTETMQFPVGIASVGEAVWDWKVNSINNPKLKDSVESKFLVGFPLPLLRQSQNIIVEESSEEPNLLENFNERLLNGNGEVEVTVSQSRISESLEGLEYLLKYPYGCVEQTTSSTLPWLSTQSMRQALPGLDKSDKEIAATVSSGMRRLLSMQTNDGGLAYWPGGRQSSLWGSSYGGMALALAQRSGIQLPTEQTEGLWKYLSKNLRNSGNLSKAYDLSQRCMALYTLALAGKAEPAYHDVLFEKRTQLPREGRSLLALAMIESSASDPVNRAAIQEQIVALLDKKEDGPRSDVSWYRQPYLVAAHLLAQLKLAPEDQQVDFLMNELMALRVPEHGWGSTYSNAWPLLALSAYSGAHETNLGDQQLTVEFGDKKETIQLSSDQPSKQLRFPFTGDVRKNSLALLGGADTRLYTTVKLATKPKLLPMEPENKGLGITRRYEKIAPDGTVTDAEDLQVGDLIRVTLLVNLSKDRERYLAIDDPLPAIFEAVNTRFETQRPATQASQDNHEKVSYLYPNHRELRTDRALFFVDYAYRAGDYRINYLARVVAPGEVIAPPAKIEAMYEPDRFGLSGTQKIFAKALQLGNDQIARASIEK